MYQTFLLKFVAPSLAVLPLTVAVALVGQAPGAPPNDAALVTAQNAQATSAVAVVGAAVTGLFVFLTRREDNRHESNRLLHEARVIKLEARLERQTELAGEAVRAQDKCQHEREQLRTAVLEDRKEIAELRLRLDQYTAGQGPAATDHPAG